MTKLWKVNKNWLIFTNKLPLTIIEKMKFSILVDINLRNIVYNLIYILI